MVIVQESQESNLIVMNAVKEGLKNISEAKKISLGEL
jgi:hypothetical protein